MTYVLPTLSDNFKLNLTLIVSSHLLTILTEIFVPSLHLLLSHHVQGIYKEYRTFLVTVDREQVGTLTDRVA